MKVLVLILYILAMKGSLIAAQWIEKEEWLSPDIDHFDTKQRGIKHVVINPVKLQNIEQLKL